MKTGSSNIRRFKPLQIRWREVLGEQDDPYLIRWTICLFGYSIRVHHWLKTDASNRHYHDHAADLLSIVLKGEYDNVVPYEEDKEPDEWVPLTRKISRHYYGMYVKNRNPVHVEGIFNSVRNFLHPGASIWFSKAEQRHYLRLKPGKDAWTLMFEGRPRHKWGFYVKRKNGEVRKMRPLEYFHRFGTYVHVYDEDA